MKIKKPDYNLRFLAGGGKIGELTRAKDWSKTSIGSPEYWPQSLRTTLSILLNSKFPMFLFWGDELLCFYNDAYRPILGKEGKHPSILGMKAEEAWKEIWSIIKPLIDQVLIGGEATWSEDQLIPIYRNGKIEDVYWTFSYSPVIDESGNTAGVYVTCTETTSKINAFIELEESKKKLEFAIKAAELGTFDYNPATNKFSANQRFKEWFGLPDHQQFDLHQAINVIIENDRQRVMAAIQTALEFSSGGIYNEQFTIEQQATKNKIILHAKGIASFNSEKIAYRINGTLQDVTEQSKAHNNIEESEKRYNSMMIESPFAFGLIKGKDLILTFANKKMKEDLGKGDDIEGKPLLEVIPELVGQKFPELLLNVMNTGIIHQGYETPAKKLINGKLEDTYYNYVYQPYYEADGTISGCTTISIEVPNEVGARKKIEASEKRFHEMVEQAPVAIAVMRGENYVIEVANQMMLEMLNKTAKQIINKPIFEGMSEAKGQGFEELLTEVYTTGKPFFGYEYPFSVLRNDKMEQLYINFVYQPFYNAENKIQGIITIGTDVSQQVRARKSIEVNEEKLNIVINASELGVWEINLKTNNVYHSERYLEIMGYPPGTKLSSGEASKRVHPDDVKLLEENYKTAFNTGILHHVGRIIWEDGTVHCVEAKGKIFYDDKKELSHAIGTVRDVTEEKLQQKILEENEEKLNLMIEASELGTWELNLKTHAVKYSKKYLEIFGYKDIHDLNHSELVKHLHPDDLGIRATAFKEAMQTGILHYEARLIWDDQSIHWMSGRGKVFYNTENQPVKMMGTIRDITSEKTHQQELEESEQKFRLLADSMPQHIWTSDTKGNLNYFNKSVFDYSGLTLEQINKDGWIQIVHPDDRKANIKHWIEAISSGKDFLIEHRFRKYNGEYRWQLSRAIPQKDAKGNIQMWVGTSTDIQEQKVFVNELEEQVGARTNELKQKNIELEKMNKELQSFAYISSHDLQEPLRKIQTFSSRIEEKEHQNLSETGKYYFERMKNAAMRMQTLINDLLAYSRTNTSERKYEKTDLQTIIEEVKADLKEELEQKNAIIETIDICDIHIIPFQFNQLLQNLISNSLKFSIPNQVTHIKIKCKVAKGKKFKIEKLDAETTYCNITVSDNGIGFDPEYNEKIFELFQRLHSKSQYNGTGIGLAIVKKIIENHNGIITAKGEKDKGATFDIYIPAVKNEKK